MLSLFPPCRLPETPNKLHLEMSKGVMRSSSLSQNPKKKSAGNPLMHSCARQSAGKALSDLSHGCGLMACGAGIVALLLDH